MPVLYHAILAIYNEVAPSFPNVVSPVSNAKYFSILVSHIQK